MAGPTRHEVHDIEGDILVLWFVGSEVLERCDDLISWSASRQRVLHDDALPHHGLVVRGRRREDFSFSFK